MPDDCYTLHLGDCLSILPTLPDKSCNCCVTSPPYYNLRDYGTATWEGGSEECDHKTGRFERSGLSQKQASNLGSNGNEAAQVCPKCGARRVDAQIGLESTPAEYVAKMVAVFKEVRRVLTDDGTLWLNLGDSYAGGKRGRDDGGEDGGNFHGQPKHPETKPVQRKPPKGYDSKSLLGIPWRVAFALQDDGWILRQDIIWAKPNPMPESVTDRCTKSHEYLFLLTKRPKYYFDNIAIMEQGTGRSCGNRPSGRSGVATKGFEIRNFSGVADKEYHVRNRRSVWNITTKPFSDAHFAVMPEALVEPCILAGCPLGGIVLDPFAGSGTVGVVAVKNGRSFIGVELNKEYVTMANKRIADAIAQGRLF